MIPTRLLASALLAGVSISAAADFQLGAYRSDLAGVYFDLRWPIGAWHAGFGASEGLIRVATVEEIWITQGSGNQETRVKTYSPTTALAGLHALELFAGRDLSRSPTSAVSASTGIGYALLDGTGEGQDGRSRDMLTIPVRLDGVWTPRVWDRFPGLGVAAGLGLEWRSGIDKPELFREMSEIVFKARFGLHL